MSDSVNRPEILIVHARGNWSGLPRLPKLCRTAGARVTIFAPEGTALWRASYIDHRIAAPAVEGAWSDALRAHLATDGKKYNWVLVGDENGVVELSTLEDTSWLQGWFPVDPTPESLERIISKAAFSISAVVGGVPIPTSHVCNTWEQVQSAANEIGYPVMVKAAKGFAGNGVRMAKNAADLVSEFEEFKERLPVVIQKFEVGRVGSTQVLLDHGRLVCWASSYKLAVFPEPFGPSSARQLMVHKDMEQTLSRIGQVTGFNGLCGVDWLHRKSDGALLVLEFNPRPAPVVHLGFLSGADFAVAIGDVLAGRITTHPPQDKGPRKILLFPQHLTRCIEGRYWRDMLSWLPGPAYKDIPWDQPKLMWTQSRVLTSRLFKVFGQKLSGLLARNQKAGKVTVSCSTAL